MKRFAIAALALLTGCSGSLPLVPSSSSAPANARPADRAGAQSANRPKGHTKASFYMTIPRQRRNAPHALHPNTVSSETMSVGVKVNDQPEQIFGATKNSKNCSVIGVGLRCLMIVKNIPFGDDTFSIRTYSLPHGGGYTLDEETAPVHVTPSIVMITFTLGPVFSNANDGGPGSLRDAVAHANAGDTILYDGPQPATIVLASQIELTKNVNIYGPGVGSLIVTGNHATRLFSVDSGVTAVVGAMTMQNGKAEYGGAMLNEGSLTLFDVTLDSNQAHTTTARPRPYVQPRAPAPRLPVRPVVGWHRLHPGVPRPRNPRPVRPHHRHPHFSSGPGDGGAIYNDQGASLDLEGDTFVSNQVDDDYEGGAVFNTSTSTLLSNGSSFIGNSAAYGGAIESDGILNVKNSTFLSNTGWHGDGESGAWGYGGAIHTDGTATIASCDFENNVAGGGNGDDSYGYGGAVAVEEGTATISSSTFKSNVAGAPLASPNSYGYGGAVYNDSGSVVVLNDDQFLDNTAHGDDSSYGGAVASYYAVRGTGDTFGANHVVTNTDGYGGAIYADDDIKLSQSPLSSNDVTASYGSRTAAGGALYTDGTATLTNVSFSSNTATGGASSGTAYGGGAVLENSQNVLTNVSFAGNTATASGVEPFAEGGALLLDSTATITASTFESNSAIANGSSGLGYGGGIALEDITTIVRSTIEGNQATQYGGGIFTDETLTLKNSTLASNAVTHTYSTGMGGGGIFNDALLTVSGTTFSSNTVSSGGSGSGGGGLANDDTAVISNSTFSGNSSAIDGGGIYNYPGSTATFVNVTAYQNTATGLGGNIDNLSGATFNLQNSIVAGGTANTGMDIDNGGTLNSLDYNLIQATIAGGGFTKQSHDLYPAAAGPGLLALANNAGPTQTHADTTSSAGYAYIPLAFCTGATPAITADQRGKPRGPGGDGLCDIGAYENQTPYGGGGSAFRTIKR